MTQIEFIKRYCQKSNLTVQKLQQLGLFAIPCDCEQDSCGGWAMITRENLKAHVNLCLSTPTGEEKEEVGG